jgi:hypothetical protein
MRKEELMTTLLQLSSQRPFNHQHLQKYLIDMHYQVNHLSPLYICRELMPLMMNDTASKIYSTYWFLLLNPLLIHFLSTFYPLFIHFSSTFYPLLINLCQILDHSRWEERSVSEKSSVHVEQSTCSAPASSGIQKHLCISTVQTSTVRTSRVQTSGRSFCEYFYCE